MQLALADHCVRTRVRRYETSHSIYKLVAQCITVRAHAIHTVCPVLRSLACLALGAILSSIATVSIASQPGDYIVADGIGIYYAVLPAELIQGHPKGHPEVTMHGGVPSGKHIHHVMVALFDAKSLDRITDAEVKATISEIALSGETKNLEPFTVAEALTLRQMGGR